MWIQGVFIGAIQGTYYGHIISNMVYASGTWLFHTLALILWGAYSDVKFETETEEAYDPDERVDVYGRSSPNMAIVLILALLLALIIFILPHTRPLEKKRNRKSQVIKIDEQEMSGARGVAAGAALPKTPPAVDGGAPTHTDVSQPSHPPVPAEFYIGTDTSDSEPEPPTPKRVPRVDSSDSEDAPPTPKRVPRADSSSDEEEMDG